MKKSIFLAVVSLLFNLTAAQSQYDHRYNIYVDPVDNEADVKIVSSIIGSLQDGTIISWRDDRSYAKVKSNAAPVWSSIADALNSEGYELMGLEVLSGVGISERSDMDPQPIFTADPVLNAPEYAIQKAQWVKDHPEQYKRSSLPSSSSRSEDATK